MKSIHLWGVNQNNLKNIEVHIPLGTLTIICGPSGSGKSSLAFETLYAEGQRRYIESLSTYTRQFLNKAPKPDIEGVENIPPAIAIEQKNSVKTSRSTVGTTTEIIEYLRLLYEKIAIAYCPTHKTPIRKESVSEGTQQILRDLDGDRGYILAPITEVGRVAKGKRLHALLLKEGYLRIWSSHEEGMKDLQDPELLKKGLPSSTFHLVIDRLAFSQNEEGRIADSLAQAYQASVHFNSQFQGGHALISTTGGKELHLADELSCSQCGYSFPSIDSRLFSFNSPIGACSSCNGFGNRLELDENKIIPDVSRTIADGAIEPFSMPSASKERRLLLEFCKKSRINLREAWFDLTHKQREMIFNGTKGYHGVRGYFEHLETKKYKMHVRVFLSRYKSGVECSDCHGTRLKPFTEHICVGGDSISKLSAMTIGRLHEKLTQLVLNPMESHIAGEVLSQILSRLRFLMAVGVDYLTLDRPTKSLSGGEYQRLNLANQLGSGLSQTLYVLDEPTVGLHPRDSHRLIEILKQLKELGNTVVVVEHDHDVIRNSDQIIEMGPGSGTFGGEVIYSGPTSGFLDHPKSNTAPFINRKLQAKILQQPRPVDLNTYRYKLELHQCNGHNLRNVNLTIPLNRFVVITGVSGSGKSTLISHTLYPAVAQFLKIDFKKGQPYGSLSGMEHIKDVLLIDQSPIGKTARSNLVTYLKVYDAIREIMASVPESALRGYEPGTFSLNVDGGRCPVCKGVGYEVIDMVFMDDIKIPCDHCDGRRFQKELLEVTYKNKNIAEILDLTVEEAMSFFVPYPNIRRPLALLKEMGLEYLRLGQPASTLSGGESQRLKIAREFLQSHQKQTLYIMDEPTTGLHFREVQLLLKMLDRLVEAGGNVVVIEHNLDVIQHADFIVDLGPEAGAEGGEIVAQGSPEEIMRTSQSVTGRYLKSYLQSFPENPFFRDEITC